MRGRIRRHAAGALSLLFLAGGIADALGAHPCPHHDAPRSPASASHATHPDPGANDHSDTPGESHGACTCSGSCHAGAAPSLAVFPAQRLAPVPEAAALSPRAPAAPARSAIVPFSLPWGNAPPAL